MSLHFKPDEELERRARTKFVKMLRVKSIMERWEPVTKETQWVLEGRQHERNHKKLLPDYCYQILEIHRRTIYKAFTPVSEVVTFKNKKRALKAKTVEEAKKSMEIDFEKMGSTFAAGNRCFNFGEHELEGMLAQNGLTKLSSKKVREVIQLLFGGKWLEKKFTEIKALNPQKSVVKIFESQIRNSTKSLTKPIPDWHQKAGQWGADALIKFHQGVAKGSENFIDKNGELKGEKKMKLRGTYEILLLAWPEIAEMLKANPPMTRNHLWDWLLPFSHARWIEIVDLEQLNRLCNEIKLRLKKPGAPFKPK